MNKKLINKIVNDVSLDERVNDGMFNIEESVHMEALRDYLSKKGMDEDTVRTFSNKILEGKYPERQAFNAKGILVTFPTPEYKADAIKRGTHFEKDPTRGQSNLFNAKPGATPNAMPVAGDGDKKEPTPAAATQPKTSLPISQATTEPAADPTTGTPTAPAQPQTTAAPQQTPTSTPAPAAEPTDLPPPPLKSPAEKEADKTAIKTMLKGDDYMLDEVTQFIQFNAPHLMEVIKKKLNL